LANPLLEVRGLNVSYGDAQALWNIDLDVREGEVCSVIGSNGAGKSTILKTVCGLMAPNSGTVAFEDTPVGGKGPSAMVDLGVALVPEGRGIFPSLTVKENLELGAFTKRARPFTKESLAWVTELFPIVEERKDQFAGKLSGGQQQMVAIGRALMSKPKLLMLDEPSLGLAPLIVKHMFEIIKDLNKRGITILLVEQNIYQALKIADRAMVLQTGHVAQRGTGAELLADPEIQESYMGAFGVKTNA